MDKREGDHPFVISMVSLLWTTYCWWSSYWWSTYCSITRWFTYWWSTYFWWPTYYCNIDGLLLTVSSLCSTHCGKLMVYLLKKAVCFLCTLVALTSKISLLTKNRKRRPANINVEDHGVKREMKFQCISIESDVPPIYPNYRKRMHLHRPMTPSSCICPHVIT